MSGTEFLGKLSAVNRTSNGWQACCPAHKDGKASLSISTGKDGRTLLKCFAGCSVESIVSAMGLQVEDLFPSRATHNCNSRILATYDYTDENGNRLFQCVRRKPKDFRQRRPDPAAPGKWLWN